VESVSQTVKDFQPGDEVFGVTGFAGGGLAEYGCAPEEKLVLKPVSSSFQEAAAIPIAGVAALQACEITAASSRGRRCW
jgi:NADPH:quinone reductase-like Zn-dependent oxidoreductase